jgi:hypothetical protein
LADGMVLHLVVQGEVERLVEVRVAIGTIKRLLENMCY